MTRISARLTFVVLALMFASCALAQTWQVQNPLPTGNAVNHISFADSQTGWAVGDNGLILKTTDGGNTWNPQDAGTPTRFQGVACIGDRVWAAGYNWHTGRGTIARSMDGGQTWTLQYGWQYVWFKQIAFVDSLQGWLVGDGNIFHTVNGGRTYQLQLYNYNFSFYGFAAVDSLNAFAVGYDYLGESSLIMRTVDGGGTWDRLATNANAYLEDVSFCGPDSGWTAAYNGWIMNTTDGGENWTEQSSVISPRRLHFVNSRTGWIAGVNGMVIHTTNNGASWDTLHIAGTHAFPLDMYFADEQRGWICGSGGAIFHTTDGGLNWSRRGTEVTDVFLGGVSFPDTSHGWACGSYGTILHTSNGGAEWAVQNTGVTNALAAVTFINPQEGWTSGTVGTLLHTTDGGGSWARQTSNVTAELDHIAFADSRHGWVSGGDGTILHTVDGGVNWIQQISYITDYVYSIYCTDSLHAWAATFSNSSDRNAYILHTSDGGDNWETQVTLPTVDLWDICMQDNMTGWAAGYYSYSGYAAFWHTTDGGQNWNRQVTSYPAVELLSVAMQGQTMMASSSWGMILRSINGGTSWTPDTSGTDISLYGLSLPDANHAWAVGEGGTILHWQAGATSVPDITAPLAESYSLHAYPNPFNPTSVIELNLPHQARVRLAIYDLEGRLVTILADRAFAAGKQRFTFDGSNLASGMYFARAESGDFVKTLRLMLVK